MTPRSPVVHSILVLILFTPLAWNGVAPLLDPPQTNTRHPAIGWTAAGLFVGWSLGVFTGLSARLPTGARPFPPGPRPGPRRPDAIAARTLYTAGCVMCLLHIAVAFHTAHAWDHVSAWEHVEQTGGIGWGLYGNYLFAAVWIADVAWAWVSLDGYLNRPRWVSWCVHGFMAFIVFNAVVVFGTGLLRASGVLMFVLIAMPLCFAALWPQMPEPGGEPGSVE